MLGQSPPTTSGIVVISGSNNFGLTSDFPASSSFKIIHNTDESFSDPSLGLITPALVDSLIPPSVLYLVDLHVDTSYTTDPITLISTEQVDALIDIPVLRIDLTYDPFISLASIAFAPGENDIKITSTPVTTSGVVVLDLFPGAGLPTIPYAPPTYLNQRLFPVTFSGLGERVFPEENRRIYPVLPQFSIIYPGG